MAKENNMDHIVVALSKEEFAVWEKFMKETLSAIDWTGYLVGNTAAEKSNNIKYFVKCSAEIADVALEEWRRRNGDKNPYR